MPSATAPGIRLEEFLTNTLRINLWSGPRNASTALMYAFAQRADSRVVDEPLYGHYLRVSGAPHPGREEIIASMNCDADRVIADTILGPCEKPVLFLKQMAHHLVEVNHDFLRQTVNVLLIRDPRQMLPSLVHQLPNPELHDTGLEVQSNLFDELTAAGQEPPVLDARELLLDPEGVLRQLCERVGIEFDPSMLRWPAGPRSEDGVWAPHWYAAVHKSTGFQPYAPKREPFPERLIPLLEQCLPHYLRLLSRAIRADVHPRLPDMRNLDILVHVGGELLPRAEAKVSVFDSSVQGGDAVWEGLRVYGGRVFKLDEHLDRLLDSAKAMAFAQVPSRDEIKHAIFETLKANGMRSGVHIRLTLTRGMKLTSSMNPQMNQYGPCLIVLPEWKPPVYPESGVRLVTASVRRNPAMCIDSKIHHNNLINNILAKIEANLAGTDDAIMLDIFGFVSETNATNIFIVKRGVLSTPHADSCLPGITRRTVIELAGEIDLPVYERNISLSEMYSADEVFTTGTMGELSPVLEVDGRTIGDGTPGPVTRRLREVYAQHTATEGEPLPF